MLGRSCPEDMGGGIDHIDHGLNPAKNAPKTDRQPSCCKKRALKHALWRLQVVSVRREIIFSADTPHGIWRAQLLQHAGGRSSKILFNLAFTRNLVVVYLPWPPMRDLDSFYTFKRSGTLRQFH